MAKLFETGGPGGPGRPKGMRDKIGQDFIKALADDFEKNGASTITKVRLTKPEDYLKIIGKLVPKEVKHDISDPLADLIGEIQRRADD